MTIQLIILFAITILQNASFTLVSRARNSGSLLYNGIASVFSNGIWLWVVQQVATKPNDMPTFVTYVAAATIGSVTMQWAALRFFEKKKSAPVQKPTIGRIVIFTEFSRPFPAIITRVINDTYIDLAYFSSGSTTFKSNVLQGDGSFQWNWPKIK